MMKHFGILIFITVICVQNLIGQEKIENTGFSQFTLKDKKEDIHFIVSDTSFNTQKPIFLFIQGSQPKPLFIDFKDGNLFNASLSNFDFEKIKKQFHIVVISMPFTPVTVDTSQLNASYLYVTNKTIKHSYSKDYLKADYKENYVNRAYKVLRYLLKQQWTTKDVVIAGHSQGARVAVELANKDKKIRHVGLFGYNPLGRIEVKARQIRARAESNQITWQQADSLMQEHVYSFYDQILNKDSVAAKPYLVAWRSFSEGTLNTLLKLKQPVYIAYGSNDLSAAHCDLLPLVFIKNQKTNFVVKRYPNLDHNFFPLLENGRRDYDNAKWEEVMNTFLEQVQF